MLSIEITGIADMTGKLQALGDAASKVAAGALYREGERIMREAKELTPVGHGKGGGTLKNSGFVELPTFNGPDINVRLGFGGAAEAYAIAVHEHLSEHSPLSWVIAEDRGTGVHFRTGGPKFLERPYLEHAKNLTETLMEDIKANWSI